MWKNEQWEKILKNCKTSDNSLWKIKNRIIFNKIIVPPLQVNNKELYTVDEKVNGMIKNFAAVHVQNENMSNPNHKRTVSAAVNNFIKNTSFENNEIILATTAEVKYCIKNLKNNKAPDCDGITGAVIKHFPRRAIIMITQIINAILRLGHFPTAWKVAKIIPIPKSGKNPTLLSSYRPISQLPHLSKIAEKVIKKTVMRTLKCK